MTIETPEGVTVQLFDSAADILESVNNDSAELLGNALVLGYSEKEGFVFVDERAPDCVDEELPRDTSFMQTFANNELGFEATDQDGQKIAGNELVSTIVEALPPNKGGKVNRMAYIATASELNVCTMYTGSAARPIRRTVTIRRFEQRLLMTITTPAA